MSEFKHISVIDAKQLICNNKAVVIDIRDERSFVMGSIKDSIRIDNNNMQQFVQDANFQKPLIVCCYHGNMSQSGASYFAGLGFEETYSLDGGFSAWQLQFPEITD